MHLRVPCPKHPRLIDFDETSDEASTRAVAFRRRPRASLTLLHCVITPYCTAAYANFGGSLPPPDMLSGLEAAARPSSGPEAGDGPPERAFGQGDPDDRHVPWRQILVVEVFTGPRRHGDAWAAGSPARAARKRRREDCPFVVRAGADGAAVALKGRNSSLETPGRASFAVDSGLEASSRVPSAADCDPIAPHVPDEADRVSELLEGLVRGRSRCASQGTQFLGPYGRRVRRPWRASRTLAQVAVREVRGPPCMFSESRFGGYEGRLVRSESRFEGYEGRLVQMLRVAVGWLLVASHRRWVAGRVGCWVVHLGADSAPLTRVRDDSQGRFGPSARPTSERPHGNPKSGGGAGASLIGSVGCSAVGGRARGVGDLVDHDRRPRNRRSLRGPRVHRIARLDAAVGAECGRRELGHRLAERAALVVDAVEQGVRDLRVGPAADAVAGFVVRFGGKMVPESPSPALFPESTTSTRRRRRRPATPTDDTL